jgi:NADH-quinone oxidoreductase subunit B
MGVDPKDTGLDEQTRQDLEMVKGGVILSSMSKIVDMARKNSLWPMPFGLSCCAIEMMAMVASRYDLARFGAEAMRFTPRQCDLMIVAGTLTRKMAPACKRIYDQMPEPKWVIAMGVCTTTGGMFDAYSVVMGIDHIIPVDVYVPGCPPRPEAVIYSVMKIQEQVMREQWAPLGKPRRHGHYRGRDPRYKALPLLDKGKKIATKGTPDDSQTPTWRKGYFSG